MKAHRLLIFLACACACLSARAMELTLTDTPGAGDFFLADANTATA